MRRLVPLLFALAACSSNGTSTDLGVEDLRATNDLTIPKRDMAVACTAKDDYGNAGAVAGLADDFADDQGNHAVTWSGDIDRGNAVLMLELYGGIGKLAGSTRPQPGTYKLEGDELQYADCGVCLLLGADLDDEGNPAEMYMATGGTVTLTSTMGRLQATIAGATFQRVEIDDNDFTSTPVGGDECVSAVNAFSIDDVIESADTPMDGGAVDSAAVDSGAVDGGATD